MEDPVESIRSAGDALGVVWSYFEDEATGDPTVLASLLLAALALATAYRCYRAMQPALEQKLSNVVAVGSGMAAVFVAVGLFFVVQAISRAIG